MKATLRLGNYQFHFADKATKEQFRPVLETFIQSPESLPGYQPVQAKKDGPPYVFRFQVGDESYVGKWSRAHTVLDRVSTFLRPPKALKAWYNSDRLRALGIDTPRVVAFGKRRTVGLVRRSILIAEEVRDAWKLHQFLYRFCLAPHTAPLRRRLMRLLGQTLGRLHAAGIHHSDFRSANLLVRQQGSDIKVFIVDTEPIRFPRPLTDTQRLKDLTTLDFTFARGITITDRLRVFREYSDALGLNRADRKSWLRKTIAACERSMHTKVHKPQLLPYRIPSGLHYREQVRVITDILEPRLREKAKKNKFIDDD